jgi:hypothetical protein
MTETQLLQEFEALAHRLEIHVSHVDLEGGPGGFCVIRGERRFILDRGLDAKTQVEIFARELSRLPLDDVHMVPALRDRIETTRWVSSSDY